MPQAPGRFAAVVAAPAQRREREQVQRARVLGRQVVRRECRRDDRLALGPRRQHGGGAAKHAVEFGAHRAPWPWSGEHSFELADASRQAVVLDPTMSRGGDAAQPGRIGEQVLHDGFEIGRVVEHAFFAGHEEVRDLEVLTFHHEQRAARGHFERAQVHLAANAAVPADLAAIQVLAISLTADAAARVRGDAEILQMPQSFDPGGAFALYGWIEVADKADVEIARAGVRQQLVERPLVRGPIPVAHVGEREATEQIDTGAIAEQHVEERP